jgi:hypothetical protein
MPECRKKFTLAFLPVVRCLIPASAFRHRHSGIRVQSGTAGHGLVRHCPAMERQKAFQTESQLFSSLFTLFC